eukprot:TRINITY_DN70252_c0_g1_i1.p1 TRINITY_DN70252_c0_g1~~TRINITY_DN70252_c0_g1_i1.p1  ORF type:complete len:659 (-),score=133.12 TRINITY_DN70252_c0_g1_i1:256-2232(-)
MASCPRRDEAQAQLEAAGRSLKPGVAQLRQGHLEKADQLLRRAWQHVATVVGASCVCLGELAGYSAQWTENVVGLAAARGALLTRGGDAPTAAGLDEAEELLRCALKGSSNGWAASSSLTALQAASNLGLVLWQRCRLEGARDSWDPRMIEALLLARAAVIGLQGFASVNVAASAETNFGLLLQAAGQSPAAGFWLRRANDRVQRGVAGAAASLLQPTMQENFNVWAGEVGCRPGSSKRSSDAACAAAVPLDDSGAHAGRGRVLAAKAIAQEADEPQKRAACSRGGCEDHGSLARGNALPLFHHRIENHLDFGSFVSKILAFPNGGLGNRLRLFACAAQLADHYKLPWAAIWHRSFDLGAEWSELFDSNLNWSTLDAVKELPAAARFVYRAELEAYAGKSGLATVEWSFETMLPLLHARYLQHGPQVLVLDGSDELKPLDVSDDAYLRSKTAFYRSLQASAAVRALVRRQEASLQPDTVGSCVGMHVRRTVGAYDAADGASFDKDSPLPRFCEYISLLVERLGRPSVPPCLLLVSNEAALAQRFLETCQRQAPASLWPRLHVLGNGGVAAAQHARGQAAGMQQSLADFLMLSRSRLIVGTAWSSFSDEAAAWGGIPKLCVIDDDWDFGRGYHTFGARAGPVGTALTRLTVGDVTSLRL